VAGDEVLGAGGVLAGGDVVGDMLGLGAALVAGGGIMVAGEDDADEAGAVTGASVCAGAARGVD
jgi:hypothetical protein